MLPCTLQDAAFMVAYELNHDKRTPETDLVRKGPRNIKPERSHLEEGLVSIFERHWSWKRQEYVPGRVPVNKVRLERVIDGVRQSSKLAKAVADIRALRQGPEESDGDFKRRKGKLKNALPSMTASGTFEYRKVDALVRHSGFVVIDIDEGIDGHDAAIAFREEVSAEPEVVGAFVSPSFGVKAIVAIDPIPGDKVQHKAAYYFIASSFQRRFGVPVDLSGSDVARLCFLSHDPDAQLRLYYKRLKWRAAPHVKERVYKRSANKPDEDVVEKALRFIPAEDYGIWWKIGRALHSEYGESGFVLFDQWSATSGKYNARSVRGQWDALASDTNSEITIATLMHYAKEYGWEARRCQR